MPSQAELLAAVDAELVERELTERLEEAPKYDWYGEGCDCPPEARLPKGGCQVHKRARPTQRPPEGEWFIWYIQAGRGFGKTECGAQWVRWRVENSPPGRRVALVGPTAADARDVMVDGPSGILHVCPPWNRPEYQPSKRRVVWPNGSRAILYSADEPERLRGPQHHDAWCDEIASWRDPAAFSMLMLGLRLKTPARPDLAPKCCITGTPKPKPWLRKIKARPKTVVVTGNTYENSDNLDPEFYTEVVTNLEGTRLGQQELHAKDLEDTPGALWSTVLLDANRIPRKDIPDLTRVVVAVDPSVKDSGDIPDPDDDTAECGICVGGMAAMDHPSLGNVPFGFLLEDCSLKASPLTWGKRVISAYHTYKADAVVAEINNGGALVARNIQAIDPSVNVIVVTASRGKQTRAEPVASMSEQGRIKHVQGGDFAALENQMTTWVPGMKSPDRMDAYVWLFTDLLLMGAPLEFGDHPDYPADWRGD